MISIIIPVFNKEKELIPTLTRLNLTLKEENLQEHTELILVDDGSSDGSRDKILEYSNLNKNTRFFFLDKNLGKGAALLIGFSNVSKKADIIGFIDADLDISPSCIKKMISDLVKDNTDMAIGSKYHPDSQVSISLRRKILSQIYRILMQALIGLNVSDTQTGVKFFKRDFLTIILSHEFHTESFAFDIELLLLASKNQIRILEHPVEMKKQFNSSVGIQNGLKALRDLVVIRRSNS